MKRPKLLHVFSAPQSVFYFLDKQLEFVMESGYEIHIILPDDGFFSEKVLERDKKVHLHFIPLKRKVSLFTDLKSFFLIFKKVLSIKPDILHLHTPKASFIGALAGKIVRQKNIIYQMHGLVSSRGNEVTKGLFFFIEKTTCSLADKVFAVSHSLKDFAIEKKYCNPSKIEVIANGTINGIDCKGRFNPDNIKSANKYLSNDEIQNKFVVGFVGRIDPDKGIEAFLTVIKKLKEENIPVYAVIVGPNETGLLFEEQLKNFGLFEWDNLKVKDEVHDPENIICDFDVLLFPSKREGFGLVAAEANALEIPVVGYDIPGVRDAIENNKTGLLVEFNNIDELYNSVLNYYNKPTLKIQHGKQGRERVIKLYDQQFLWQSIVEKYNEMVLE